MQYNDMFWRIFEKSGNLDAYMGYTGAASSFDMNASQTLENPINHTIGVSEV